MLSSAKNARTIFNQKPTKPHETLEVIVQQSSKIFFDTPMNFERKSLMGAASEKLILCLFKKTNENYKLNNYVGEDKKVFI